MSSFGRRHLCFLGIKFLLAIINNTQSGDYRCQDAAAGGIVTVAFSVCLFVLFLFLFFFFGWGERLFSSGCTFLITGCQPHSSVSFDGWSVIPSL